MQLGPDAEFVARPAAAQPDSAPQHAPSFVYLCDPRTEGECLERLLFGLPVSQAQAVSDLVPEASYLFLFNVRVSTARTATAAPPRATPAGQGYAAKA